jgi:hypothetical protein
MCALCVVMFCFREMQGYWGVVVVVVEVVVVVVVIVVLAVLTVEGGLRFFGARSRETERLFRGVFMATLEEPPEMSMVSDD